MNGQNDLNVCEIVIYRCRELYIAQCLGMNSQDYTQTTTTERPQDKSIHLKIRISSAIQQSWLKHVDHDPASGMHKKVNNPSLTTFPCPLIRIRLPESRVLIGRSDKLDGDRQSYAQIGIIFHHRDYLIRKINEATCHHTKGIHPMRLKIWQIQTFPGPVRRTGLSVLCFRRCWIVANPVV